MNKTLSRYHPRYFRSLVYMLQVSDYQSSAYLGWLNRVQDFSVVENRKRLDKTPKATVLLTSLWLTDIVAGLFIVWVILYSAWSGISSLVIILLSLLGLPLIFPYIALVIAVALNILQKPLEYWWIREAKKILEKHPAKKIAIAGSYGKTTFKEILKTVLSEGKIVAATPGNMNTPIGIARFARSLKGNEGVLIFEFGEYYPGDIKTLAKFVRPGLGVITGVNEAHLDRFKNIKRTAATIFELADWLKTKPVYLNGESALAKQQARPGHILYSRRGVDGWKVAGAKADLTGTKFKAFRGKETVRAKTALLGLHQIGPILAAIDIAYKLRIPLREIEQGIMKVRPFEHRMEPREEHGVLIIDDSYNGSPDGARAAIEFLETIKASRRFYVTPGFVEMGGREKAVHNKLGQKLAKSGIERVVLFRNSVTPYIEEGLKSGGFKGEVIWFEDALVGYRSLPNFTVKGDVVLLQNDWPDNYA